MAGPVCVAGCRRGLAVRGGLLLAVGLWACLGPCDRAWSQTGRFPSNGYYGAFGDFYDGDYDAALKQFSAQGRMGIRTAQSRWIDSICYETMIGECYYEMGHLSEALEHYTFAVQLAVAFPDWMLRVQFPAIRPAGASTRRGAIPWGASTRGAPLGDFPRTMMISQGQIDITQQLQQGGIVQAPTLLPIDVAEIVRCTTLAIRRRAKLLGPLASQDPLFLELVRSLGGRVGPPNHWSEAWVGVELGVAQAAVGREGQAVLTLQRAVVAGGEFDHPLTATALFELGRLAAIRGDLARARYFFLEASYAAAYYPSWCPDVALLEECFRYGQMTELMANHPEIYPPLATAIPWAKGKHFRQLYVSLLLLATENHLVRGETHLASVGLEEARIAVSRRSMGLGRIGARYNFLNGTYLFQLKKVADGDAAITAAMNYMQHGSHWLFQISLADILATTKASPRTAMDLYQNVLRDPQAADWSSDPMESLAVLILPHPLPYEHWFNSALKRKDWEAAIEIGDRMRRHRFFTSLAYGGRLESLRWILEAADEQLDTRSKLQRQDLLTRYPAYNALRQHAHALHDRLAAAPLATEDREPTREQVQWLTDLAGVSKQQEVLLHEMAVRREPAGLIFPPCAPPSTSKDRSPRDTPSWSSSPPPTPATPSS